MPNRRISYIRWEVRQPRKRGQSLADSRRKVCVCRRKRSQRLALCQASGFKTPDTDLTHAFGIAEVRRYIQIVYNVA
jgi:hypothetical protein